MQPRDIQMKRAAINSLAEQFANYMILQTAKGHPKSAFDWAKEMGKVYPDLPPKEKKLVANKVVRIIKAAGSPDDAGM
jgi:hypothetical protein